MKNNLAKGSNFFVTTAVERIDGYITVLVLC